MRKGPYYTEDILVEKMQSGEYGWHRQRECGTVCEVQRRTVRARNGKRERLIQSCYGDKKELESKTDGLAARDA